jgi:type VI protein secretion system component VasK
METGERRLGMDPDTGRRLAVLGGAALITAVSFALIFVVFAWLPSPMFAVWMRMSHEARMITMTVYFFAMANFVTWSTKRRQRLQKLRGRR